MKSVLFSAIAIGTEASGRHGAPTSPTTLQCPSKDLSACLQDELDDVRSYFSQYYPDLVMQLGFHRSGQQIGIASGSLDGRALTIDDTFTFGSGTKPFTAAAVMRLIDSGAVNGKDKAHGIIDPYLQKFNGTTMAALFGENITAATVLDIIRMTSGIPDFEIGSIDYDILANGGFLDYPFETLHYIASQSSLACYPGTCEGYSSTSYEAAGLLLAAVLTPDSPWYAMDLGDAVLSDRSRYPSLQFPPVGKDSKKSKLSDVMTVPGNVTASRFGKGEILFNQNPAVLGWTCGNMVGSARDVATFFYDLLHEGSSHAVVSDASRAEMTTFKTADYGWFADHLRYGAGVIQRTTTGSEYVPSGYHPGKWGYDIGHVGETYGFASQQGYFPSLQFSYSIASNVDEVKMTNYMACRLHQVAIEVLGGELVDLQCSMQGPPVSSARQHEPTSAWVLV